MYELDMIPTDDDIIILTALFWTLNKERIYLSQVWPQNSMQYVK